MAITANLYSKANSKILTEFLTIQTRLTGSKVWERWMEITERKTLPGMA